MLKRRKYTNRALHNFNGCLMHIRVGRKVGGTVARSKMVDLDGLRVCDMPINSVTYLLLNRPQQDPPIFAYSHIIKRQLVVQVCIVHVCYVVPKT